MCWCWLFLGSASLHNVCLALLFTAQSSLLFSQWRLQPAGCTPGQCAGQQVHGTGTDLRHAWCHVVLGAAVELADAFPEEVPKSLGNAANSVSQNLLADRVWRGDQQAGQDRLWQLRPRMHGDSYLCGKDLLYGQMAIAHARHSACMGRPVA